MENLTDRELFEKYFELKFGVWRLRENIEMPQIVRERLKCFECGNCFKNCPEPLDCAETPIEPPNPRRFENAPPGFFEKDETGRSLYIPLCGKKGYE